MFWMILLIIDVIGLKAVKFKDSFNMWTGQFLLLFIVAVVLVVVVGCLIGVGLAKYPEMVGEYESLLALNRGIKEIREAQYIIDNKGNEIISGSLDNQGQSVAVSTYLTKYYACVADYNDALTVCQLQKNLWVYRLFGFGFFIPAKINELKNI